MYLFIRACAVALLPFLCFSTTASASLLGDEVDCFFDVSSILNFAGSCSTEAGSYVPDTAIVDGRGFADPEFYLGTNVFGSSYLSGVAVDIEASALVIRPLPILFGFGGDLILEISSLDWVNNPAGVITDVIGSGQGGGGGSVSLSYTDHSVRVVFDDFRVTRDSFVRLDLVTDHSVPVPATWLLVLTGMGLAVRARRAERCPAIQSRAN